MPKITEKGLVAILALASCTVLLAMGKDTVVGFTLLAIVTGYFGIEVWPYPQIRSKKRGE